MSNYNIKNVLNFLLHENIQTDFTKNTAIPVLQKAFGEEGFDTLADFDQYVDDAKYDERALESLKLKVRNILDNKFFPDIEEELVNRIVNDLLKDPSISEAYKGPKKYKKVVGSGKNKKTVRYGAKGYSIAPGTSKGDSYCARSYGQMKDHPSAAKDANSPLRLSRKKWKCSGKRSRKD
jgi:hypothetical protein